jgi:curved DNA-binding protein CbpA
MLVNLSPSDTTEPDCQDANPGAEERFKETQHAYEVLSDPNKRREHDERCRPSSGLPLTLPLAVVRSPLEVVKPRVALRWRHRYSQGI